MQVRVAQAAADRVRVSHARGQPPTAEYKVTVTHFDGWRNDALLVVGGAEADRKAQATGEALLRRISDALTRLRLVPFTETRLEVLGAESMYGPHRRVHAPREVVLRMSAKHPERKALELLAREFAMAATSMAPGTMALVPGRPTPSPLVRVFSCLLPKRSVPVRIVDAATGAEGETVAIALEGGFERSASAAVAPVPSAPLSTGPTRRVPLVRLCWGRSGDKGDTANIGIIARRSAYLPFLRAALTEQVVADWMAADCLPHCMLIASLIAC